MVARVRRFGRVGTVQVVYSHQSLCCQNLYLQLLRQLALLLDASQHLIFLILQSPKVIQPLVEITQHLVVQRSGRFLSVSGNKWNCIPLVDELHRGLHLPPLNAQLLRQFLTNIHRVFLLSSAMTFSDRGHCPYYTKIHLSSQAVTLLSPTSDLFAFA